MRSSAKFRVQFHESSPPSSVGPVPALNGRPDTEVGGTVWTVCEESGSFRLLFKEQAIRIGSHGHSPRQPARVVQARFEAEHQHSWTLLDSWGHSGYSRKNQPAVLAVWQKEET